jgi:DNA-binding NtrC family response regulator
MDGLTLGREIKSRYPTLPVVLTSGYSDVAETAEREFAILRKPFQMGVLDRVLRHTLQRQRRASSGDPTSGG